MNPLPTLVRAKELVSRRPAAFDLLRQRNFRNFWLANAGSDLGFELRFVAASWLALQLTDSALWVGLILGIRAVPIIALALFGGAVTDRVDRRQILIVARSAVAALGFLAGFLVSTGLIEAWPRRLRAV